jgi:hypothetical protein
MLKKETSFSHTKPRVCFLEPSTLKTYKNKRSSHDVFSPKTSLPNTRANNLFSKKENNQRVQDFKNKLF